MLTESDAKQRWCPWARAEITDGDGSPLASANRLAAVGHEGPDIEWPDARCIASDCMAWRWDELRDTRERKLVNKKTGAEEFSGTTADTEWVLVNPLERMPQRMGYCGLAGKP